MSNRLDLPRRGKRSLRPAYNSEAFGQLSERFARFLGTANFLVYMSIFVLTWVLWNAFAPTQFRFDPFPFIFLTLILSLQASYAAPLILLAQNRQADRDRIQSAEDRLRDERNLADTEYLTREIAALRDGLGDVATRDFIRSELRELLAEIKSEEEKPAPDSAS